MKAMKTVSTIALACVLALGVTAAASPALAKEKAAESGGGIKLSDKVLPIAQALQKTLAAKDYATAKTQADQAAALAAKPDDKYFIGNAYVQIGQGTNDNAALAKGIDMMLESGKADAALAPKLAIAGGQVAFQSKDYAKAESLLTQARKLGNTDPAVVPMLVESIRLQNRNAAALAALNDAIAQQTQAGQPVPSEWFQRGYLIVYQAKPGSPDYAAIRPAGHELIKKWVAADPKGDVWHDALLYELGNVQADNDLKIDVNRLLLASGGLHSASEYLEYVELVYLRFPAEAKAVLDAGVKKGLINMATNRNASEINQIVTSKIPADKASLPASDKSARAAATGKAALGTADAYFGYGEYAKAIDLYNIALQKGGVDANIVNMRIGIAQFKSGDSAGAKASFAKVTGPRKDIAELWAILIDHPSQS